MEIRFRLVILFLFGRNIFIAILGCLFLVHEAERLYCTHSDPFSKGFWQMGQLSLIL